MITLQSGKKSERHVKPSVRKKSASQGPATESKKKCREIGKGRRTVQKTQHRSRSAPSPVNQVVPKPQPFVFKGSRQPSQPPPKPPQSSSSSSGSLIAETNSSQQAPRPNRYYHELGQAAAARWPMGLQVLSERIVHNYYKPEVPEPLCKPKYVASLLFLQLRKFYRTVFSYHHDCSTKYTRSFIGSNHTVDEELDSACHMNLLPQTLIFESRFESGNLLKAVQISDYSYELHLRCDLYCRNWSQWYYFQVRNVKADETYRFAIVNCGKSASLYGTGMKPLMYSERLAREKNIGWHRCGEEIVYVKTSSGDNEESARYTLKWITKFPYSDDTVYFADCYPYTYTDLQDYLRLLMADSVKSRWCTLQVLCRSLAGNYLYLLTISAPSEIKKKRVIIITARVHPGETVSSWVMKGFIDFLTGTSPIAARLRESFIFKLVPMLNPDGVIVGNNRCALSARDLNRCYRTMRKEAYPGPWHIRRLVQKCQLLSDVVLYCDLHGHCRKHNMFVYGCENPDPAKHLKEQIFPLLLQQNAPDLFSFLQCRFLVEKQREGTGRVVMWSLGINNSYTLEVSHAGSMSGKRCGTHFNVGDYEQIAHHFCSTIWEYFDKSNSKKRLFGFEWKFNTILLRSLRKSGSSAAEPVVPDLADLNGILSGKQKAKALGDVKKEKSAKSAAKCSHSLGKVQPKQGEDNKLATKLCEVTSHISKAFVQNPRLPPVPPCKRSIFALGTVHLPTSKKGENRPPKEFAANKYRISVKSGRVLHGRKRNSACGNTMCCGGGSGVEEKRVEVPQGPFLPGRCHSSKTLVDPYIGAPYLQIPKTPVAISNHRLYYV